MRKLGISIYPERTTKKELFEYLDKSSECGFSRIFSCLLSVNEGKEKIKETFKEINLYAKSKGFEIILDVNPRVFEDLGISYKDLSFFKEVEADGIRLDIGFTGLQESIMTFNKENLKIEINMSNDVKYLETILGYKPNKYNLIGCHNFYPHAYTGLGMDFFMKCTDRFVKNGIRTAAFISSQAENTYGPWPVSQGLVTLEMHRNLPLIVQYKHLVALEIIDDIIISNCYPTIEELEKFKKVRWDMVSFDIETVSELPEIEEKIIFDEFHYNRGDISENVIRSTQSRVKYKENNFYLFNTPEIIKRGDVIIESSEYGHYAGELMIALKDMKNTGKSNVVGRISEEEIFILDYIKPWQKFSFVRK
ncbi:MAG: DUF871 domain-containing protein [Leptotrichiaceae bacterium]|nr:DUF871 domain-containing protein [Leptotrichiaceae bacterium]MBP7725720.1 DUF871 domain-containing protein [Leptotrichiaceae bacterium]